MNDKHRRVIRRAVADLFVFSLVISVLMLATPLYLLQIYDRVLASASVDTLLFLSMIVLVALIANGVVDEIRARYADRLALSIDKAMASGAFAASLAGPGAAAGDPGPLRDLATIRQFLTSRVAFSLFDLPFAPLFLVVLFLIHPLLCLIASAGTILLVVIAIFNRMATREEGVVAQRESVLAAATAQAFARNQETVKALGMQAAASEAWGKHFGASVLSANRVAGINSRFGGASRTLRQILQSAILGAGAWLVLSHQMTAGMIFASSIISGRALMPIDQIINGWRPIMDAFAAWKRLKQAVGDKAAATDAATQLPDPAGRITVENLVYFIPGTQASGQPLLKRLNFDIPAGETVAIIGPSRAGKSTLVRLMVGAIAPTSGMVRLDGADIAAWPGDSVGKHIGYMPQEVELFSGTIARNVARFDPGASDARIVAAAVNAGAHEIIVAQPGGYDTVVGPMGVRISGGERQRIALARALYGDPKVIVLDEPNANLDLDGEASLERAMHSAKQRGATVVIVTHRQGIAARCDRILVLNNGVIELFGPAAEVMKRLQSAAPAPVRDAPAPPPSSGPPPPGARFTQGLAVPSGAGK